LSRPGIHPLAPDFPPAGGIGALRDWLDAAPERRPRTRSGHPVRFVEPPADGLPYETRIWEQGAVATRGDDPHDFCNALVWLNFPQAKAALNARHVAAMQRQTDAARRDPERDALTHFDECGAVVVSRRPELLGLIAGFDWKTLFWQRRDDVRRDMALLIFGHATLAALSAPFRGLTAKAMLLPVGDAWFAGTIEDRLGEIDRRVAARIDAGQCARAADLQPLPLLGWPGITAASEDEAYFDDRFQFRPGRRRDSPLPAV
jgi:hypothetical protein